MADASVAAGMSAICSAPIRMHVRMDDGTETGPIRIR
jgi:hypothetical protein